MSRIEARFSALQAAGRKALIPYITAGDPNPAVTLPLMHDLVAAGADVIELGIPFSDPMADGPVIQLAMERARLICEQASGYVYYVSLKGVTGSSALNVTDVAEKLDMLRTVTDLPIGVGFGIRDGESAAAVAGVADGVVVGSVLVNQIAANADNPDKAREAIAAIVADMRSSMDR